MNRQIIKKVVLIVCSLYIILKGSCSYGQAISHSAMRYAVVIKESTYYGLSNQQLTLLKGDTREVVFTCNRMISGIKNNLANREINSILGQNYPNPASDVTMIGYRIPANGMITINLFDIFGRQIDTIEHCQRSPGEYMVEYNVSNLKNGIYYYNVDNQNAFYGRKLIVLK